MAILQNRPTRQGKQRIPSGFVTLGSIQAISFDTRMISNYSRRDVKIYLNGIFALSAGLSVSTAIILWIAPFFGFLWALLAVTGFIPKAVRYVRFALMVARKARELKEKPFTSRPAGGTRAPPPSIIDRETFFGP
jgi:hypothetical protein